MLSILGMGHALASHEISNDFLHREVGLSKDLDWVRSRLGIERRFSVLSPDYIIKTKNEHPDQAILHARAHSETPVSLGVKAARAALERAGIKPRQIGLVIANCDTPFETLPATASLIAQALGIGRGSHFDVNAACSSFARHLQFLADAEPSSLPDFVLCVQTSAYTTRTDYRADNVDGYIWGDGSAAQVLSAKYKGKIGARPLLFEGDPSGADDIMIDSIGHFRQDGQKVRHFSVRKTSELLESAAEEFELAIEDAYVVTHQANFVMQDSVVEHLGIGEERMLRNVREQGNIAAAGCPSVISQRWDDLKRGDKILYAVVGAGLAWGAGCLEVQ